MKTQARQKLLILLAVAALGAGPCRAAFLVISLPGTTSQDNWTGLTAANYPGYPAFATSANPWPAPIAATSGNGGSQLNKVSGLGFPSNGGGIYSGGLTSGTGTYAVSDSVALGGLETVVFQLEIEGVGASWTNLLTGPSLSFNGGAQALSPAFTSQVSAINTGTMFGQPSTRFTMAFQWDLSAVSDPISSISVLWTASEHSLASSLQLVQGDTMVQVVPEPSAVALTAVGIAVLGFLQRRLRK